MQERSCSHLFPTSRIGDMHDIVDTIASWCGILSFPTSVYALYQIVQVRREAAKMRELEKVGNHVLFVTEDNGVVVDFKDMPFLPREGEHVTLQETPADPKCSDYRVVNVRYLCFAENDDDTRLISVRVEVEPMLKA